MREFCAAESWGLKKRGANPQRRAGKSLLFVMFVHDDIACRVDGVNCCRDPNTNRLQDRPTIRRQLDERKITSRKILSIA
jgi:hypothetical protein